MVALRAMTPECTFPCAADETPLSPFDVLALLVVAPPPPAPKVYGVGRPFRSYRDLKGAWPHPPTEPERMTELEGLLAADFNTFREVGSSMGGARGALTFSPCRRRRGSLMRWYSR
jgi:hypothetical protein